VHSGLSAPGRHPIRLAIAIGNKANTQDHWGTRSSIHIGEHIAVWQALGAHGLHAHVLVEARPSDNLAGSKGLGM